MWEWVFYLLPRGNIFVKKNQLLLYTGGVDVTTLKMAREPVKLQEKNHIDI